MKYKYIMTGSEGLIGKELRKSLKQQGHKCVLDIDRVNGNIVEDIHYLIYPKNVNILFHLVANCKINKCIENPGLAMENIENTFTVLEYCRTHKIPKIIYFSSSRVLNKERNPYVASKIAGEELVKAYAECYGLQYLIVRPSTVYGGEDKTGRLIDIWIKAAKENKPLYIYGDQNKTLSFTYIKDFIDGVLYYMDENNKEVNIMGKEENLTNVALQIIRQTKSNSTLEYLAAEIGQPQNIRFTSDYLCNTTIEEGIRKCLL